MCSKMPFYYPHFQQVSDSVGNIEWMRVGVWYQQVSILYPESWYLLDMEDLKGMGRTVMHAASDKVIQILFPEVQIIQGWVTCFHNEPFVSWEEGIVKSGPLLCLTLLFKGSQVTWGFESGKDCRKWESHIICRVPRGASFSDVASWVEDS